MIAIVGRCGLKSFTHLKIENFLNLKKGENISAQEVEHELSKSTNFAGTIVAVGLKLENFDGYPET